MDKWECSITILTLLLSVISKPIRFTGKGVLGTKYGVPFFFTVFVRNTLPSVTCLVD